VENQSVRLSRAGDAFHYRWAARRCLRLLDLNSELEWITVEGSREPNQAGEYVIDVAEYTKPDAADYSITYFQLKHSTKRVNKPFTFSDLKSTLKDFSKRYIAWLRKSSRGRKPRIAFSIVTNRRLSVLVERALVALRDEKATPMKRDFENATKLKGLQLQRFCSALSVTDGTGDYLQQMRELRGEMAGFLSGSVDANEVDGLVALVSGRALPDSNGVISQEDVMQRLGVTSRRQLFPAPPKFDTLANPIKREHSRHFVGKLRTVSRVCAQWEIKMY
jgi:hypothetical protein